MKAIIAGAAAGVFVLGGAARTLNGMVETHRVANCRLSLDEGALMDTYEHDPKQVPQVVGRFGYGL